MSCPRCNGLVVNEVYHGKEGKCRQTRCVNCGWIGSEAHTRNNTLAQATNYAIESYSPVPEYEGGVA